MPSGIVLPHKKCCVRTYFMIKMTCFGYKLAISQKTYIHKKVGTPCGVHFIFIDDHIKHFELISGV